MSRFGGGPATGSFTGLLKYYRWKVKTITGGTAITFTIRGMVRTN